MCSIKLGFNDLTYKLKLATPLSFNNDLSKSFNLFAKSLRVDLNDGLPLCMNEGAETIKGFLSDLAWLIQTKESLSELNSNSFIKKNASTIEDYDNFKKDLTDEYLNGVQPIKFVGTVGANPGELLRKSIKTTPLTMLDLNIPLARDFSASILDGVLRDDTIFYDTMSDDEKRKLVIELEQGFKSAILDPLTLSLFEIKNNLYTNKIINMWSIDKKPLPGANERFNPFLMRQTKATNILNLEFYTLNDTLNLTFTQREMNVLDMPFYEINLMGILLFSMAKLAGKKVGVLNVNINRVFCGEDEACNILDDKKLRYYKLELDEIAVDVTDIVEDNFSYEIL